MHVWRQDKQHDAGVSDCNAKRRNYRYLRGILL